MALVVTHSGKKGDFILAWPVAKYLSDTRQTPLTVWLDQTTLAPMVRLIEHQPCVEKVELKPGVTSWHCGGQPHDMSLPTEAYVENEIHHLGLRKMPERQITLQTALDANFHVDTLQVSSEPSLFIQEPIYGNRVVLHGTFLHHHGGGVPGFWKFLNRIRKELDERFEDVVFVGTPNERARALEIYPGWKQFDDGGDFLELARLIAGSRLLIGAGSSVVTVGGALKIPTIRVHDPIGEYPKYIWSNLGGNQINDTELELRKSWPQFRDQFLAPKVEVV